MAHEKIDNIQKLFEELPIKKDFIKHLAPVVDRSPLYMKQHWFREFWAIPPEFQAQVEKELNEFLNNIKTPA